MWSLGFEVWVRRVQGVVCEGWDSGLRFYGGQGSSCDDLRSPTKDYAAVWSNAYLG